MNFAEQVKIKKFPLGVATLKAWESYAVHAQVQHSSKDKMLIEYQQVTKEIEELLEKAKETETMCIMTQGNKEPYMEQIKAYYSTIARLRERAVELKKKLASNEKFQDEIKRISGWLEEDEVSFAEYDDDIVRYLVESIYITQDLKLIINMKRGETVEKEIYIILKIKV